MAGINRYGNTKMMEKVQVKNLASFPVLTYPKSSRVYTKHYANLAYIMPQPEFNLLCFICSNLKADNLVKYGTMLQRQYAKAVNYSRDHYKFEGRNNHTSPPMFRIHFRHLIQQSFLIPMTGPELHFMVNPMISYSRLTADREFFAQLQQIYQHVKTADDLREWACLYLAQAQTIKIHGKTGVK